MLTATILSENGSILAADAYELEEDYAKKIKYLWTLIYSKVKNGNNSINLKNNILMIRLHQQLNHKIFQVAVILIKMVAGNATLLTTLPNLPEDYLDGILIEFEKTINKISNYYLDGQTLNYA